MNDIASTEREDATVSDFRGGRPANKEFQLRGIHHLAHVCRHMARTIDFCQGTLGMPVVKTIELPSGGQHFFFDLATGTAWPSSGSLKPLIRWKGSSWQPTSPAMVTSPPPSPR
jgi:catechol 2,3-dioxygenase-like lactoylglutathione lyase family enzyme